MRLDPDQFIRSQMPEDAPDDPPEELIWHWNLFFVLSRRRSGNGYGPNALAFSDIAAWQSLTGDELALWELDLITELDDIYLEVSSDRSRATRAADSEPGGGGSHSPAQRTIGGKQEG